MRRRLKPKSGSQGGDPSQRANDALTNLSAYALTLDVEYHRLDDRLLELVKAESEAEELRAVLLQRDEIGAEREAFRRSVAALREQAAQEPEGPADADLSGGSQRPQQARREQRAGPAA